MKLPVYQFSYFAKAALFSFGLIMGMLALVPRGFSQEHKIDSLKKLINSTADRTAKADLLYQLSYEYIVIDLDEALRNALSSQGLAYEIGDSLRIVKASLVISSAFRRLEQIDNAIIEAKRGLEISTRNNFLTERKILLNSLAIAHSLKAEYDQALGYHFQSLIMREESGTKAEVSITLNNIGFVYFKLKNYEKALEYYLKSLELKLSEKDLHDLDKLYINIGLCNIHLKNFEVALESIEKGFKTCSPNCTEEILIEGDFGKGVAYFNLSEFDKAKKHFLSSASQAKSSDLRRWEAENLIYLAKIALRTGNIEEAESLLRMGEKIAVNFKYNQLVLDYYKEFSKLYTQTSSFQNASIYQDKYIVLKDSLIGEELVKNIAKTQTQFEERENLRTIELKDEALARQRMLNLAIGTIAFLAALLVFVLYHNNKVRRRVNAKLTITNAKLEESNAKLNETNAKLAESNEKLNQANVKLAETNAKFAETNTKLSEANSIIESQNKQLQSHANKLQAEVNKATADLLVANTSLEKVNKELDNFIYKTSHDIRGPLASLKGMCNVALMDVKDQLALDYLQKLDETATKLNRILTRLLIINQINSAAIHPEPLDMDKVVDDIILLESKKGLPKGFQFKREIQRNMIFRSDDALIRIILENLIDNAIKFHNDSDRVVPFAHIKIFTEGPHMHIHVIDNGVGIALENPDKIFQMFTRASEKSGTGGLGLYLIKQAVTRLGGDVGLRLTPEAYTEFYATLPLELPKELTQPVKAEASEEIKARA